MYGNLRTRSILCLLLAGITSPVRADLGEDQYAVAASHYRAARWELAADEFSTFLTEYPRHRRAESVTFFLAESLVQLGRFDEAHPHFRDYLRRAPAGSHVREATFRIGETSYLAGRHEQAQAELERFRDAHPDDPLTGYVHVYVGEIALSQDDPQAAHRAFTDGLRQFPDGPLSHDCRYGLARSLEKLGNVGGAVRFFQFVADQESGSSWSDPALLQVGILEYQRGDFPAAQRALARHRARFPASDRGAVAAYWLGLAQTEAGAYHDAAATLTAAAPQFDTHTLAPALHFAAGEAYRLADDAERAEPWYRQVVDRWPESPWADDSLQVLVELAWQAEAYDRVERLASQFGHDYSDSPLRALVEQFQARVEIKRGAFDDAITRLERWSGDHAMNQPADDPPTPADLMTAPGPNRSSASPTDELHQAGGRYYLALAYLGAQRHACALSVLEQLHAVTQPAELVDGIALARASALLGLERFEQAVAPLRAYLTSQPTGVEAARCRAQLAIALARLQRWDEVPDVWGQIRASDHSSPWYLTAAEHVAEAAAAAGQSALAATCYEEMARDDNPPEIAARGLSGLAWLQWHEDNGNGPSVGTFERLVNTYPDSPPAAEAAMAVGRVREQEEQWEAALAMYQRVMDRHGQSAHAAPAMLAAARMLQQLHAHQDAESLLRKWLENHPDSDQRDTALYQWGWVLVDLARDEQADGVFQQLRDNHRNGRYWADATYRLAERAARAGNHARAEQLATEIIQDHDSSSAGDTPTRPHASDADRYGGDPIVSYALYLRGQLAASDERWSDVERWMRQLDEEYPRSVLRLPAAYWMAEALYRQRRYALAEEIFDRLDRETAGRDDVWVGMVTLRRAQVRAHSRRWDEAYDIAQGIADRFADFPQQYEVDYLLGRYHASRGELAEARRAYERVTRSAEGGKTETAAMAQWMIGETLFMQEQYQPAIRAYHRVEALYAYPRWQAAALLQAGKCYEMIGQWSEAIERYQQIMRDYSETEAAQQAARRLTLARQQAETARTR